MLDRTQAEALQRSRLRARYDNFIGGKWQAPVKGRYFTDPSPIDGMKLCEVARSDAADVELALDAAHAARDAWGRTAPAERARLLLKIADRIDDNLELLAYAETMDNGKPIRETRAADVPLAADHFRYFAGCIRAEEGTLAELDNDTVAYHFKEPMGVVAQIIPWNFPLLMAAWKMAPALATGNCVVIKPASDTPLSLAILMDLTGDILPPGVLNVVNGHGSEVGAPLASSPRIAKVSFTGETTTGRQIMQYAAENLIPSTMELGRQIAEHLHGRRDGSGRRLPRQGAGRFCPVRLQQGRGLHLPVTRAGAGIDLRQVHGEGGRPGCQDPHGPSARSDHADGRAGVARAA